MKALEAAAKLDGDECPSGHRPHYELTTYSEELDAFREKVEDLLDENKEAGWPWPKKATRSGERTGVAWDHPPSDVT